jgi:hypothetical protein
MDTEKKAAAKPAAPKGDGFTKVGEGKPKHASTGKISAQSALLQFKDAKGKIHTGYAQEYLTDINAHHLQAKKGDVIFFTPDNVTIPGVKSFKEV